MTPQT